MATELKQWSYAASNRIMLGLAQELNITPGTHYHPSGYNSSRVLSLRLSGLNPHYLGRVKSMQASLTMWAGLDEKHPVRITQTGGALVIEVPKPGPFWKHLLASDLPLRRGLIATLGLGLRDEPKRVNFGEPAMAHTFITGQTRSGKTNTQRLLAWNIAHNTTPEDAKIFIFDVAKRGYKWADFGNVAALAHPVITTVQEADSVLSWLTQEIIRRADERRITPRLFAFVDELKALTDDSKVAVDYLARIASVGGEFGLHLILSTQYPQIQMLKSAELKRNVTTRLCGKVDDATAALNALGVSDSGAESLQGYGDFLLKDFNGLTRLTVAHLQDCNVTELPRGEVGRLELPDSDTVNDGPKTGRPSDEWTGEQIGLALFKQPSINGLQKELGIGGSKATRLKRLADDIRQWAISNGYTCLE